MAHSDTISALIRSGFSQIEYIWKAHRSWMQCAYIFVRHFPYLAESAILMMLLRAQDSSPWGPEKCLDWLIYQLSVFQALIVVVEAVLVVRVYAMFNHNVAIVTVLFLLFVAEIAAMIVILALSKPGIRFLDSSNCLISHVPKILTLYLLLSLAFETILFGLTLVKFYTSARGADWRSSVLYVLVRDGAWAYALIFIILLANTLMYRLDHNGLAGLWFCWGLAIPSFAGSHILLNLRRLSVPEVSEGLCFTTCNSMLFVPELGDASEVPVEIHEHDRNILAV
ncbi:uncharacterized protein FIBRA_00357 [Fibroporia radiculosa]|uniref:Uncharacterized protein n=1 Tax=Fibroporia radiculosa TaxID=599839 RepID=J7RGZ5_9APHY|nr:uncharacterized protein FIBRA_00357 [Fibroporia radiculosa]CCL98362.1 predicted protein [Fibroporia radiculosa]